MILEKSSFKLDCCAHCGGHGDIYRLHDFEDSNEIYIHLDCVEDFCADIKALTEYIIKIREIQKKEGTYEFQE